MSNSDRLTGPDFLDAIADQNEAQGLSVNANEFRQRAHDWRADHARIEQLEARVAELERAQRTDAERERVLADLRQATQAANDTLATPPAAATR
jgi:TATA-binding protein-associated factor Taf7